MTSALVIDSLFDQRMMQLAMQQADFAQLQGEVPVGAVLVSEGNIIATGHNQVISERDPTAHAELVALRLAGRKLDNYRLPHTTVYVTLEPCPMCLSAMFHARVARLVFGAPDLKTGACGGRHDLTQLAINHHTQVQGGVLDQACALQLQSFFKARREATKLAKMAS